MPISPDQELVLTYPAYLHNRQAEGPLVDPELLRRCVGSVTDASFVVWRLEEGDVPVSSSSLEVVLVAFSATLADVDTSRDAIAKLGDDEIARLERSVAPFERILTVLHEEEEKDDAWIDAWRVWVNARAIAKARRVDALRASMPPVPVDDLDALDDLPKDVF